MMTEVLYSENDRPEGSSYEYTDRFMQEISKLVDDSIREKSESRWLPPGFGSSSVNSCL
jgi:HAE1 family hydrophobic/amphiphilic exporter-1/multidrug efflux pump